MNILCRRKYVYRGLEMEKRTFFEVIERVGCGKVKGEGREVGVVEEE